MGPDGPPARRGEARVAGLAAPDGAVPSEVEAAGGGPAASGRVPWVGGRTRADAKATGYGRQRSERRKRIGGG
jgi:hypothetical protein